MASAGFPLLLDVETPEELKLWTEWQDVLSNLSMESIDKAVSIFFSFNDNDRGSAFYMIQTASSCRWNQTEEFVTLLIKIHQKGFDRFFINNETLILGLFQKGVIDEKYISDSRYEELFDKFLFGISPPPDEEFEYVPTEYEEFFTKETRPKWNEYIEDLRKYHYPKDSLQYILKYDKIDELIERAKSPTFDYNQNIYISNYDVCEFDPFTPLSFASFYGSERCVRYLLLHHQGDVPSQAIEYACAGGNSAVVRLLAERGDISLGYSSAVNFFRDDIADWIQANVRGAKWNVGNFTVNIRAAVREPAAEGVARNAAIFGVTPLLELCLARGTADDMEGITMLACLSGSFGCYEAVKRTGFDMTVQPPDEQCALHRAAEGGNVRIIEDLIDAGIDINVADWYGETPLESALRGGLRTREAVKWLKEHGAIVNERD